MRTARGGDNSSLLKTVCDNVSDTRRPVSRVLSTAHARHWMTIHLGRPLPDASRDQPGQRRKTDRLAIAGAPAAPIRSCSRWGLPCRPRYQDARCALTAPFHPYLPSVCRGGGGLLSVALSLGSPPPAVTRHRVSVEPGLSSQCPRSPKGSVALRGHPADWCQNCHLAQLMHTCTGLLRVTLNKQPATPQALQWSKHRPARCTDPVENATGRTVLQWPLQHHNHR